MYNALSDMIETMNRYGRDSVPYLFIIDYLAENPQVIPIKNIDPEKILFSINGFSNIKNSDKFSNHINDVRLRAGAVPFDQYKNAYDIIKNAQENGETYLANLTFQVPVESDMSLKDIFFSSRAKYRLWYNDNFIVFSPETFVQIHDGIISSFPMKGTIDASSPDAETILISDEKEFAEHVTIVDLIRNDMNIVAENITVEKFRYIEKIKSSGKDLLQTSSKITGRIRGNCNSRIGTIIASMLPAGSVTGAPKRKTVEIINMAENYDRGYYTGVFGYFDGNRLDCGVMIRFIEKINGSLFFKCGGGITVYSDPLKEYMEMMDKINVPAG